MGVEQPTVRRRQMRHHRRVAGVTAAEVNLAGVGSSGQHKPTRLNRQRMWVATVRGQCKPWIILGAASMNLQSLMRSRRSKYPKRQANNIPLPMNDPSSKYNTIPSLLTLACN
ncbi:unnamed protein product [Schistocephalus solidus]|uniref:Uncharacterized protein n=1 Tax=Schistocephalus solidus TaxID=70667 RepID=A0A183T307_SCHSO|nr:unnamed protein product [Schistocephalus solidus]